MKIEDLAKILECDEALSISKGANGRNVLIHVRKDSLSATYSLSFLTIDQARNDVFEYEVQKILGDIRAVHAVSHGKEFGE